jgi:sorting nexin-14
LETLRYKYEDFLQRLLQKSLLQTSELLHLFLTVDGDFSMVVQASTLNANSNDIANIYQSVAHKLRKEKGQHLESFLTNLLVSSDMERYQAL